MLFLIFLHKPDVEFSFYPFLLCSFTLEVLINPLDNLTNHLYSIFGVFNRLINSKGVLTAIDISCIDTVYKDTPWNKDHLSYLIKMLDRLRLTLDLEKNEQYILDKATSFSHI